MGRYEKNSRGIFVPFEPGASVSDITNKETGEKGRAYGSSITEAEKKAFKALKSKEGYWHDSTEYIPSSSEDREQDVESRVSSGGSGGGGGNGDYSWIWAILALPFVPPFAAYGMYKEGKIGWGNFWTAITALMVGGLIYFSGGNLLLNNKRYDSVIQVAQNGQQDTVFFKDMTEQELREYDNLWRNEYNEINRELSSITLRIGNSRIPILEREREELEEQINDIEFEMKVRGLSGNFFSNNNPLKDITIGIERKNRYKK